MNSSVCSTCQLWKLGGTPWNFAFYTNSWMVWPSCLTLLLTTDVTSHILQGLTVTPFKFHLLVPQAITNTSFVKPPSYGMNYRLRSSHLRLLPPLREHVCFFTVNNTYTSLLCFFCSFCVFVCLVLGTWSVLAFCYPCILCLVHEILNKKNKNKKNPPHC